MSVLTHKDRMPWEHPARSRDSGSRHLPCSQCSTPHALCVYSVQVVILGWLPYATVCQMGKLRLREDRWSGSARLRQDCGCPSRSGSGPVLFWLFLLAHHTLLLACSLEWLPRPSASVWFHDLPHRTSHWCYFFRTQPCEPSGVGA